MTWIHHLRVREGVPTKSGVTQDKSNCVPRPQIAIGDGALKRVIAVNSATRSILRIARHHCEHARVGFRAVLVQKWRRLVQILNTDGRLRGAKWCMP